MIVSLKAHTLNPDITVAESARLCYASKNDSEKATENLIEALRVSGHTSTFEHASFTFLIEGVSRVTTHQLVRHRMASYSQQSQRYVKENEVEIVIPPSIMPEFRDEFRHHAELAHQFYLKMVQAGIPAEDARFILPHGWESKIMVTMNGRELQHFIKLRSCKRSQWEIRELAYAMLTIVHKVAPVLFKVAGPACINGGCTEKHPCGNPYKNMQELLDFNIN